MPLVRAYARLVLLAVLAASCSSGTEPPTPTTIVVRTSGGATSASLTSIGQTVGLVARVVDQNGDTMQGQTVTWSSGTTTVASVSVAGTVTAVGNGTAQITATAGSASGSLAVTVAQVATAILKQGGDAQTGTVGAALAQPLTVRVVDALGVGVAGGSVAWAVASGGGTIAGGNADASGIATAIWTPGTTAGTATATATAGGATVIFGATLQAAAAAQIAVVAGDNQNGAVGLPLATQPRVRVSDQYGNAKAGITVTWTITAGGGSVSPASTTTGATGETATTWTLGSALGANGLQASAGAGINVTFGATGVAGGTPTNIAMLVGDNQTALAGFATNIRPAVVVTDAAAQPVSGVQVVFTPSGGGSVTAGTVTTNAQGIAQVGSWTPNGVAGGGTLAVSVTGFPALTASFTATAAAPAYNIEIRNIGPAFSPAVQAAFDAAEALWEQVIYGDMSDVAINTTNACSLGATISETVDDVIILARFDSIDGPGQILGQAGACSIRVSNGLSIYGQMRFDTADVATLGASINAVILHEMGHVLGFSAGIFNSQAGITNPVACAQLISAPGLDSHFNCTQAGAINAARAMFDSIGGTSYTGGSKVPLENCVTGVPASCGAGTLYSHWRESTFFNELMTGYLNSGAPTNPLSVLSITAMQDIGYRVNYAAAQAYTRTFTAPAAARGPGIDLTNDEYRGDVVVVDDRSGRVVRVIRR
jgi:hypothetical protein